MDTKTEQPDPLFFNEDGTFKSPEMAAFHAIHVQGGYSTPAREARRIVRDGQSNAAMARTWLEDRGLSLDGDEEPPRAALADFGKDFGPVLKAETLGDVPAPPAHVDLDDTAAAWHHAATAATAEIARLTEIRDQAIANLQAAMGDAPEARIAGRKAATWAWAKPRMILNRDSLEAKYGPEEIATHLRASKPSRPFKLTGGA